MLFYNICIPTAPTVGFFSGRKRKGWFFHTCLKKTGYPKKNLVFPYMVDNACIVVGYLMVMFVSCLVFQDLYIMKGTMLPARTSTCI